MSNKYEAVILKEQLIYGHGNIVIVTGWTPKSLVEKKLKDKPYAAIGNLYSPNRGIEVLLINLLNNPQINTVLALKASKNDETSGSIDKLKEIFYHGVSADDLLELSEVVTYEHLESIRKNVDLIIVSSLSELEEAVLVNNQTDYVPVRQKIEIEPSYKPVKSKPGPEVGYLFSGSFYKVWLDLLDTLQKYGRVVESPYGNTKELVGVSLSFDDTVESLYEKCEDFNLSKEFLSNYLEHYLNKDFQPDEFTDTYTYADRMFRQQGDQVKKALEVLCSSNIESRRVLINLWLADKDTEGQHPPCMVMLQFLVRNKKVICIVTFRSSEVFGALPANAIGIRKLHSKIVSEMKQEGQDVNLGPLYLELHSAHVNESNLQDLEKATGKISNVQKTFIDPTGRYLISLLDDSDNIEVQWWTNSNLSIATYQIAPTLKGVMAGIDNILKDNPQIDIDHFSYLYKECLKAMESKITSKPYFQF